MSRSNKINKKLWSIHNWVGLYAGVVIAILSVTGVIALFRVEIDEAIDAKYFKISAPNETTMIHPEVNTLIDSLKLEYGADNFGGITPSLDKSKNWIASVGIVGNNPLDVDSYQIFFNPYTGKVVGKRDFFKSFRHYIRHLHVRMFNGLLGRWWVGLGGLALLISTITGILIYGGFMKRQFFGAIRKKNLKLRSADYHKIIGMTTLLFNLMIAITGAWLGLQAILQPVLQVKSPERYKRTEKPISKEDDIAYAVDYIKAFETSRALFPDLEPTSIAPSQNGKRTVTIRGDVPKTAYQNSVNFIVLDKKNYTELGRYDIREQSLHNKAYYAQEGLHYGDFGGVWVKVIYSFFGLTSGALSILGFVLYLERTKSTQKKKVNYKTTGKKVGLWTFWLTAFCILLFVTLRIIGRDIPTLIVTLAFWLPVLFYLIKYLVVFSIRGIKLLLKKINLIFNGSKARKSPQ
ncbi:MAG: PepSY-associated TM helix domain-containing protein [Bacteroidota bacterium]